MIAIVDDDPASLSFLSEVLTQAGLRVRAFGGAAEALAGLESEEPQLVLSDVVMPEMSGLELRTAYGARHPERRTPFVFLSSLGETADVVRGLEAGADDYLQKPVAPALLVAKVRAQLRRGSPSAARAFHGDLAMFPFAKIVEFCELQGLTGEVELEAGRFRATIAFRGGAPLERSPADGEAIARALELDQGRFLIRAQPVDFGPIATATTPAPFLRVAGPAHEPSTRPAGRLSAVSLGDRLVQLQTEYVTTPVPMVVTVALRDGRTLQKRTAAASGSREEVERLVDQQHGELEREIRAKLAELSAARLAAQAPARTPAPAPSARPAGDASLTELLEAGLDACLAADYRRALELFEQAQALDGQDRVVQVNLAVVRRKLGLG